MVEEWKKKVFFSCLIIVPFLPKFLNDNFRYFHQAVWPHSGHYRPTEENFNDFVTFLKGNNVSLTDVKVITNGLYIFGNACLSFFLTDNNKKPIY